MGPLYVHKTDKNEEETYGSNPTQEWEGARGTGSQGADQAKRPISTTVRNACVTSQRFRAKMTPRVLTAWHLVVYSDGARKAAV